MIISYNPEEKFGIVAEIHCLSGATIVSHAGNQCQRGA